MADIVISYLRENIEAAERLAKAICCSHHSGQPSGRGVVLIDLGVDTVGPQPISKGQGDVACKLVAVSRACSI